MVFGKDINVTEHKRQNFKSVSINFKTAIYSYALVNHKLNQNKRFFFFTFMFILAQASLFY